MDDERTKPNRTRRVELLLRLNEDESMALSRIADARAETRSEALRVLIAEERVRLGAQKKRTPRRPGKHRGVNNT